MKPIYFDNASTTKVRPEVIEIITKYFSECYGNSAGKHPISQKAKVVLDSSREMIAEIIGAKPHEIIFTSGGTESNNFAIQGLVNKINTENQSIISSAIEHSSVVKAIHSLELQGHDYFQVKTDNIGVLDLEDLDFLINDNTSLVSIMHANNEIGTIQPIKKVSELLKSKSEKIVLHTDAVQSLGKIPFNINDLGVDMASFSAHKINGPKGIGALFVKEEIRLKPLIYGGGQEWNMRSGTVNVPLIAGFAKALELCIKEMEESSSRLNKLQAIIVEQMSNYNNVKLNGPIDSALRLPGNIHYTFGKELGKRLLNLLDCEEICVSAGSACNTEKKGVSSVLKSIGYSNDDNVISIRISLGRDNTTQECLKFLEIVSSVLG